MAHGSSSDIDGSRGVVARRRPVVAAGACGWCSTGRVALGYPGVSGRSLTVCLRYPGRPSVAPVVRWVVSRWSALPRASTGRSTLPFVRSETSLSHASLGGVAGYARPLLRRGWSGYDQPHMRYLAYERPVRWRESPRQPKLLRPSNNLRRPDVGVSNRARSPPVRQTRGYYQSLAFSLTVPPKHRYY